MTDAPLTSEEVAALVSGNLLDQAAERMDARVAKLYPSNEGHSVRVGGFRNHAEEIDAVIRGIHPGLRRPV